MAWADMYRSDTRRLLLAGLGALLAMLSGCDLDLGQAPFICNKGEPKCPDGYECVQNVCLKGGVPPADSAVADRAQYPDIRPGTDSLMPFPDGSPKLDSKVYLDLPQLPDGPPPKPIVDGGIPPHFGCQSNAECATDSPCCCPMPLLPQFWTCLPLCLNPFCI